MFRIVASLLVLYHHHHHFILLQRYCETSLIYHCRCFKCFVIFVNSSCSYTDYTSDHTCQPLSVVCLHIILILTLRAARTAYHISCITCQSPCKHISTAVKYTQNSGQMISEMIRRLFAVVVLSLVWVEREADRQLVPTSGTSGLSVARQTGRLLVRVGAWRVNTVQTAATNCYTVAVSREALALKWLAVV